MPWRWQRSSKKRRKPSPCEWDRKSGAAARGSRAASSRYLATEKKLSARKNQPLVTFGSQLARNALESWPPIASIGVGMIDRHIALAAAGFVVAGEHGDAFEQGRFAGAVFADDDGDGAVEVQHRNHPQERQAERIGGAVGDA